MDKWKSYKNYPLLKEGATGNSVIYVQSKLKEMGLYDASITGSFDAYTTNSVVKLQKAYTLVPNGVVDKEIWNILDTSFQPESFSRETSKPTLKLGSTGTYVKELQTVLANLLYYSGDIDWIFGNQTGLAVKTFQKNNHLTPDGIVGKNTWSALFSLYSPLAICEETPPSEDVISYVVKAGDTLWKLATRFQTTVDTIKNINHLTSDTIYIGQTLLIPSKTQDGTSPTTYTVVSGDTLWKIAKRFNTTVDELKRVNHLTSDTIYIGQTLLVPSKT